jgi:hypothetical protein
VAYLRLVGGADSFRWEVVAGWGADGLQDLRGSGTGTIEGGTPSGFDGTLTCTAPRGTSALSTLLFDPQAQSATPPAGSESLSRTDVFHYYEYDLFDDQKSDLVDLPVVGGSPGEHLFAWVLYYRTEAGDVYPQVFVQRGGDNIDTPEWVGTFALPIDACGGTTVQIQAVGKNGPLHLELAPGRTGNVFWNATGVPAPTGTSLGADNWYRVGLTGDIACR